jgi:hypothetical protein
MMNLSSAEIFVVAAAEPEPSQNNGCIFKCIIEFKGYIVRYRAVITILAGN